MMDWKSDPERRPLIIAGCRHIRDGGQLINIILSRRAAGMNYILTLDRVRRDPGLGVRHLNIIDWLLSE